MIVSKGKSAGNGRSPTPPKVASVSPVASGSNSPSSLGDGNVLSGGSTASPTSHGLTGGHATSSTMATSTSYSPTGMAGNGGGVISSSMSPTTRSALSMSPPVVDPALQSTGLPSARTHISSPDRAQSSLSPQISARSSKSTPTPRASRASIGAGVVSSVTNQNVAQSNNAGTTTKSTGLGAFIFSKKKTEKFSLLEPLVTPKSRSWAPAVVANTSLASLPNDPLPKPKQKYLVSSQASTKIPNARRPVRYQDFVPTNSLNKYGTYSRAHSKRAVASRSSNGGDTDDENMDVFGVSSKNLKNGLPAVTTIGGPDSVLGDEDGPGGLFVYDVDDDWLEDIVEPDMDDPIHKNDTTYTYIDVDSLLPVDDKIIDADIEKIEAHLNAIASPLALPPPILNTISEEAPKKKKKLKKSATTKKSKQTTVSFEPSSTAGTHSSSPSATANIDLSASPTSPSPPIAASGLSEVVENLQFSTPSESRSPRPSANPDRVAAPATWRPSRNNSATPVVPLISSISAENISIEPTASSSTVTADDEIKVKRSHSKRRAKESTVSTTEETDPTVKKKKKKKKRSSETTETDETNTAETPEESTTEPSTPREKKDKERKKKKKRRETEETDD